VIEEWRADLRVEEVTIAGNLKEMLNNVTPSPTTSNSGGRWPPQLCASTE